MLRYFCLRQIKNVLKVADAERALCQQVDNPQSVRVAEALVNLDQIHESINIRISEYLSMRILKGLVRLSVAFALIVSPER